MLTRILGQRWLTRLVSGREIPGKDGDSDRPKSKHKQIRIWDRLRGRRLLETMIHEFTHCAHPKWDEEAVEEFSRDLALFIYRMGFRLRSKHFEKNLEESRQKYPRKLPGD